MNREFEVHSITSHRLQPSSFSLFFSHSPPRSRERILLLLAAEVQPARNYRGIDGVTFHSTARTEIPRLILFLESHSRERDSFPRALVRPRGRSVKWPNSLELNDSQYRGRIYRLIAPLAGRGAICNFGRSGADVFQETFEVNLTRGGGSRRPRRQP